MYINLFVFYIYFILFYRKYLFIYAICISRLTCTSFASRW